MKPGEQKLNLAVTLNGNPSAVWLLGWLEPKKQGRATIKDDDPAKLNAVE